MKRIRISAKALIIKNGKMAAIKIRDYGEEWLDTSTLNLQPLYPSKLRRQDVHFPSK